MRKPVASEAVEALEAFRGTDERIHVVEGDIWCFFARDPGSSRLLSALGRKPIGIGTSRNWNTVYGIADLVTRRSARTPVRPTEPATLPVTRSYCHA